MIVPTFLAKKYDEAFRGKYFESEKIKKYISAQVGGSPHYLKLDKFDDTAPLITQFTKHVSLFHSLDR